MARRSTSAPGTPTSSSCCQGAWRRLTWSLTTPARGSCTAMSPTTYMPACLLRSPSSPSQETHVLARDSVQDAGGAIRGECHVPAHLDSLSFAIALSDRHGFDFRPSVQRKSFSHDHRAATPTPPLPLPRRRPPSIGPRERRLAPATGGVQAGRVPAEAPTDRSPVLGGPLQVVDRLEENACDRSPGHGRVVAA